MTFDEWWNSQPHGTCELELDDVKAAWDAGRVAYRQELIAEMEEYTHNSSGQFTDGLDLAMTIVSEPVTQLQVRQGDSNAKSG